MSQKPLKILLIGCGKMGGAMLRGWHNANIAEHIYIFDNADVEKDFEDINSTNISWLKNNESLIESASAADVCVMAVKPDHVETVCMLVKPAVTNNMLVLSIAAGKKLSLFEEYFGSSQPIVRAMPNIPASIGKGISVLTANGNVNDQQKDNAESIMQAVGEVEWLDNENHMDAVTALSGSGPAYLFLLIETLTQAGETAGLEPGLSRNLARETVIGSAALAEANPELLASTLRKNVTSPGGTTEAALKILMDNNEFQDLFDRAIEAATNRGQELGS